METLISTDGTSIAFDRFGEGPPVILIYGAFTDRKGGAPLAALLARSFTVLTFDRRGRGASENMSPYSVEREVEDLDALIAEAGGSAAVFGYSSGAVLALEAAARESAITKFALFEPPCVAGDKRPRPAADLATRMTGLIAAGRRGDAVDLFYRAVGDFSADFVAELREGPFWPGLEDMVHTAVHDAILIGDLSSPIKLAASVTVPALLVDGTESLAWMREGTRAVADAIPHARHHSLAGQAHDFSPSLLAPVLEEFYSD